MKKVAFDKLPPITVTQGEETYTIPPEEFARICPVCIKGARRNVLTQATLTKLQRENPEAMEALKNFFEAYGGNQEEKTSKEYIPTEEEKAEMEKRDKFFAQYENPRIASMIYYGYAPDVSSAEKALAEEEKEKEKRKLEKERRQQVDMFKYQKKPFTVEVNFDEAALIATNGRTADWNELDKAERKEALKNVKKITLSLQDYIKICPWNVKIPTEEEIKEVLARK